MSTLQPYQRDFVDFLVASGTLSFGDFVTKSGRKTPYFINTGNFNSGERISRLGSFYAAHIVNAKLGSLNVVFGPAYKGIPLAVSTAAALFSDHKKNVGYSFNRKEVKDHGDGGLIVGHKLRDGDKVVILEDVVTAGTTLREVGPLLRGLAKLEILGVVIAVDRCERGTGELSAVQELKSTLDLNVYPLLTIHQIVAYLSQANSSGLVLSPEIVASIEAYLAQYGVKI